MIRGSQGRNIWLGVALFIPVAGCGGESSPAGSSGLGGDTSTVTASASITSTASAGGMGGGATSSASASSSSASAGGASSSAASGGGSASSGQGGAGGAGGGATSSGQGGAMMACVNAPDCPPAPNECVIVTCNGGFCGTSNVAAGTATVGQVIGDCKATQCDGSGAIKTVNDDIDVPDDGNPCTDQACSGGVASSAPSAAGKACGLNLVCDGSGTCVGCVKASDCGVDTDCQQHSCTANQCGIQNKPAGTVAAGQTSGD